MHDLQESESICHLGYIVTLFIFCLTFITGNGTLTNLKPILADALRGEDGEATRELIVSLTIIYAYVQTSYSQQS